MMYTQEFRAAIKRVAAKYGQAERGISANIASPSDDLDLYCCYVLVQTDEHGPELLGGMYRDADTALLQLEAELALRFDSIPNPLPF